MKDFLTSVFHVSYQVIIFHFSLSHAHKSFIPLGIHAYIFDLLLLVISEEMFMGDDNLYTYFEFVKNDISRRNAFYMGKG